MYLFGEYNIFFGGPNIVLCIISTVFQFKVRLFV